MKSFAFVSFMAGGALAAMSVEPAYLTTRPPSNTYEPSLAAIEAAAATIQPSSPTSNVPGAAFNRFFNLWLENVDYNVSWSRPMIQPRAARLQLLRWKHPIRRWYYKSSTSGTDTVRNGSGPNADPRSSSRLPTPTCSGSPARVSP